MSCKIYTVSSYNEFKIVLKSKMVSVVAGQGLDTLQHPLQRNSMAGLQLHFVGDLTLMTVPLNNALQLVHQNLGKITELFRRNVLCQGNKS